MSNNPLANKLKGHIPDAVYTQLTQVVFEGVTPLQLAHFLAQCDHESGGFKHVVENLKYTKLERIVQIFSHDVDTNRNKIISQQELDHAQRYYVGNPEKLANFVYANQNGNGDEASGDGWKYRGRGYIQLTGRENYKKAGISLNRDFIADPDLVAQAYPLTVSLWFFAHNKIFGKCSAATEQAVKEVTRMVNGSALVGLNERIKLFNKYWELLK